MITCGTMRQSWSSFSVIHGFILILMFSSSHSQGQTCESGWFGGLCQYKCHCTDNKCDDTGECTDTAKCAKGWFGPACQYVDLAATESRMSNQPRLTDGDSQTCIDDQASVTTSVILNRPFPFSWLRLQAKEADKLEDVDVRFATVEGSSSGTSASCNNMKRIMVDAKTVDIYCDPMMIQQVNITGNGVKSLCSLHISGGRNVALKQKTSLTFTSRSGGGPSSNAVNGDTSTEQERCTSPYYPNPTWNVDFSRPQNINRYVLYSGDNSFGKVRDQGLERVIISSYSEKKSEVFTYQLGPGDRQRGVDPDVYTVTSPIQTPPISSVSVTARSKILSLTSNALTLCEVELYGDSECPPGKYGRECEHTCNCAVKNEDCFVSTGGCPSGCAAGYYGESCNQPCPLNFYGVDCKERCNANCADQLCDRITGFCDQCSVGFTGDMCDKACPLSFYGADCKERCNANCADQLCDRITGFCDQCSAGYTGDMCDKACGPNTYGQDCGLNCSQFCKVEENQASPVCYPVTGVCLLGCQDGYEGLNCDNPKEDIRDKIILGTCVAAAAVGVVVVVVVVIVFCHRRKLRKAELNGTAYDSLDFSRPDNHVYNVSFKTNSSSVSVVPEKDAGIPVQPEMSTIESEPCPADENAYSRLYDYIESNLVKSAGQPELKTADLEIEGEAAKPESAYVSELPTEDTGSPAKPSVFSTESKACPSEENAYTRLYDYCESNNVKTTVYHGQKAAEKEDGAAELGSDDNHYVNTGIYSNL